MEPSNQTLRELLGNGVRYTVPRFQRDYAWTLEQWEDLWADIESIGTESPHYMGYIVLQKTGPQEFEIIDGQQRMITLSLLMVGAIRQLKDLVDADVEPLENDQRVELLRSQFIGTKNPVSLRVDNKLALNRNNQPNFKAICSRLEITKSRGRSATNVLIDRAAQFFMGKPMGSTGEEIAQFAETVASGMVFTKIVVHDDLNAYKVFETLNARGVQLSTPDLLKNYIFSTVTRDGDVPDEELDDIDSRWSGIVEQIGDASFTDFVRYHHNSRSPLVTKRELFSTIRKDAASPKDAYAYLESLECEAPVFSALLQPDDEFWQTEDRARDARVRDALAGLKLFNIRQPLPLLMAAYGRFSPEEFAKLAGYVYVLSIRYNVVCRRSPGEQEAAYNQISVGISNGTHARASHVKNSPRFKKLYPDDDTFVRAFERLRMPSRRSSKKIRFLLTAIESRLGFTTDFSKTVLEHVCPFNVSTDWEAAFGEGVHDVQDQLGNMVILEKDHLGRAARSEKWTTYQASGRPLAQKVATYSEWTQPVLREYQAWLAEQAKDTWRVDFA
ncbi:MAG: DUF262 domain-containing protein [Nannocystaceae bacterium]|nr:DUF262 domain-containing protein [Nannocystaceae bacterium]